MRLWFPVGAVLFASGSLVAQEHNTCQTPPDLEAALKSPSPTQAYNALGAHYAGQHKTFCAIEAFETAVRLQPSSWEGHYNLGLALLERKSFQRAQAEFQAVIRIRPDWPDAHNALGSAYQTDGRAEAAITQFQAALGIDPANVFALQKLTEILIDQRRYTAAIKYLTPVPKDASLRTNLAIAYSKNGNTDEAIGLLKQLVAEEPGSALAHFNLATEFAHQKLYRESIVEYREALRLDPSNDLAITSLVKAHNILAEYSAALPLIEEYAKRRSDDFEAPYLLGEVYRGLGRYADAVNPLRRAVKMRPDHYEALYNLGFVLAKQGQYAEALPKLEKAISLRPDATDARYQFALTLKALNQTERARQEFANLEQQKARQGMKDVAAVEGGRANQLLTSGDARQAVAGYRDALRSDPDNARTYYNLAVALDRLGERIEERQALEQAVRLDSTLALAQNQLGLMDLQDGRISEAESRFNQALALDPQFAEAQGNLGVLYGQQGKIQEAESLFRRAIENNPKYAQGFLNLGLILAGQERFAEAEKQIETAIQIAPDLKGSRAALGMVRARMGRSQEAIAAFRQVVAEDPSSPDSHLNLGIALADSYDVSAALAEFSSAVDLAPNSPAARYNKGRALFDLRKYREASVELRRAVELSPSYFEPLYLLAVAEKQMDNRARSAELLRKAVTLRPRDADAHYLLGQNLSGLGKKKEAIAEWKTAVEIDPGQSQALSSLVRALQESDAAEAARYKQQITALQDKRMITDRAGALANLALASAAAHDSEQAISHLTEAIQVCGDCPSKGNLHKNLGLIYCRSGNLEEGEKQLRIADRLLPGDSDIAKSLQIIATRRDKPAGASPTANVSAQ
jgi:tetratricopeptide (TPR) repeat protein